MFEKFFKKKSREFDPDKPPIPSRYFQYGNNQDKFDRMEKELESINKQIKQFDKIDKKIGFETSNMSDDFKWQEIVKIGHAIFHVDNIDDFPLKERYRYIKDQFLNTLKKTEK